MGVIVTYNDLTIQNVLSSSHSKLTNKICFTLFLRPTEPLSSGEKFPIDGRKLLNILALM